MTAVVLFFNISNRYITFRFEQKISKDDPKRGNDTGRGGY